MKRWQKRTSWLALGTVILASRFLFAQAPLVRICGEASAAPACQAVRGDRSEGWLPQTRSEVMARNGMVTTVQPLAAQAGLRILQQGGNAIDAAVATAAVLNVIYPANIGIGGDLFALIYVAKEKKVYQLNASGIAPSGLTLDRMHSLGYKAESGELRPGLRHAARRHPDGHRAGLALGLAGSAHALRHEDVQGRAAAGDRLCGAGISDHAKKSPTAGA